MSKEEVERQREAGSMRQVGIQRIGERDTERERGREQAETETETGIEMRTEADDEGCIGRETRKTTSVDFFVFRCRVSSINQRLRFASHLIGLRILDVWQI